MNHLASGHCVTLRLFFHTDCGLAPRPADKGWHCKVPPISCILEKALEAQIVSNQPCFVVEGQRRCSGRPGFKPPQQPGVCVPACRSCACRKPAASVEKISDCPPPREQCLQTFGHIFFLAFSIYTYIYVYILVEIILHRKVFCPVFIL